MNIQLLQTAKFRIEAHDAGWHQIQKALRDAKLGTEMFTDLKVKHDLLKGKILPSLYEYGIVMNDTGMLYCPGG